MDLHGRRKDRVWYADVKLIFTVEALNAATEEMEKHDLAWVQWYENFGTASTDSRVHIDPDFPPALRDHFPRIYLPEHENGASYEVVQIEKLICPAPVHDDVSVPLQGQKVFSCVYCIPYCELNNCGVDRGKESSQRRGVNESSQRRGVKNPR